jgi:DNA-binding response OmpR family regulator
MSVFFISNNIESLRSRVNGINKLGVVMQGFSEDIALFKKILSEQVRVLIIDLEFSSESEESVQRYLAINPNLLIIILMGYEANMSRQRSFLDAGSNRVLSSAVDNETLLANIKALLRFSDKSHLIEKALILKGREKSTWKLKSFGWLLISPSGYSIELTAREYQLIYLLCLKQGDIVNKHFLAETLLGKLNQNGSLRMNLLVGRLRNKCLTHLGMELPIKTVHAIGYSFISPMCIEK